MDYRILPPDGLIEARVTLPLSKSMSNRALAIAALTPGEPLPSDVAVCDDTRMMTEALAASDAPTAFVGAAGTAMRFLAAVFAATPGVEKILDGSERMRKRPIGPLVDALRQCGASITYLGEEGYPPLKIIGSRLKGGEVTVDASVSSQFISALLIAAPVMEQGLTLTLTDQIRSKPYIDLTLAMMRHAGARADWHDYRTINVEPGSYQPADFKIETDWSAAAFWYEIQALSSGFISIEGLKADSPQGDRACARIFENFGVVTEFDGEEKGVTELMASPELCPRFAADMSGTPDLVQPVVATCCMLRVPFRISGIDNLRLKETDRIAALITEMKKIGVTIEVDSTDTISWEGRVMPMTELPEFDTYADHRMAMALAPVALYIPGIVIRNAEVVDKSYPDFWDNLREAGFILADPSIPLDQLIPDGSEDN